MKKLSKSYFGIIIGSIILFFGLISIAFKWFSVELHSYMISFSMVVIIVSYFKSLKRKQGVTRDELTRKIADRSAAYSWQITLITLLIIYWLNFFEILKFSINGIVAILYITMIVSMIYFQKRFWKNGNVE